MNRPQLPGAQNDGTENVTRAFGHRGVPSVNLPGAPEGWGGMPNPNAGLEGQAMSRAAESIATAAMNTHEYFDNLRTAEEASRAKLMLLEMDKADAEVRNALRADPEHSKLGTEEQQRRYELERDSRIQSIYQSYNLQQKKVVRATDEAVSQFKAGASSQYLEKEVRPVVALRMMVDAEKATDIVLQKVAVEPTASSVAAAVAEIDARYSSPEAYAAHGAVKAHALRGAAIGRLQTITIQAARDRLKTSPLASFEGGIITTENLESGEVQAKLNDEISLTWQAIDALPIGEDEKLALKNQEEKVITSFAKNSVIDHNKQVKEAKKAADEEIDKSLSTWQTQLLLQAEDGRLSRKALGQAFDQLMAHPLIKGNVQAEASAFKAFAKVRSEIVTRERHQEKLESDRKTRETIAQYRVENGVDVSGAALDSVWRKDGRLDAFFKNNAQLTPELLRGMDQAGAVPTSILGQIQHDLRSADKAANERGVRNLIAIRQFSPKTQQGLYRELPQGFSLVLNSLELGAPLSDALKQLHRPRQTPDIEAKLRDQSRNKDGLTAFDKAVSNTQFRGEDGKKDTISAKKVTGSAREQLLDQWEAVYAEVGGNLTQATALFQERVARMNGLGVSQFSGVLEVNPATNFADKDAVLAMIAKDFPELKDAKEIIPLYNGTLTVKLPNGEYQSVPTYLITYEKDGVRVRANSPFAMTHEMLVQHISEQRKLQEQAALKRATDEEASIAAATRSNDARMKAGVLGTWGNK